VLLAIRAVVPGVGRLLVRLAFCSVSVCPFEIGGAWFGTFYGYCLIFRQMLLGCCRS
jgi:hypothetical protein